MISKKPIPYVIIVGGGPSGLLLALLLGRRGIPVLLLEAGHNLDERPRATHYGPPAVYELRRAGIFEDMRADGAFSPSGVCWRKLDGEIIAGLPGPGLPKTDPDPETNPLMCLPLNRLGAILKRHLARCPSVEIRFGHKVVGLGQDGDRVEVEVDTPDGMRSLEAEYIVGCDGANSQVRRSLFGEMEFPGFTWEEQVVATNTYYPFEKHGFNLDANFIVHPEHWYMAARITNDGMWRVSYGELPGLSFEELKARQPMKFKQMLPGNPDPDQYRVVNFSPYKVHQRLAKRMRVGRVLLAADAAHLCNPFGGMGLTGGIVDVGGLYDCLAGIYSGVADDSILDRYDEIRRQKYNEIVNPVSTANIRRLFDQDPDGAVETDPFLKMCKQAETDSTALRMLQDASMGLQYDFTQHYHDSKDEKNGML